MPLSEFELPLDRISTSDAFGKRIFLFPREVKGAFRKQRLKLQFFLIAFFLFLPWLQIQGRQALLFNISERHFEIFGLSLRAHNAPLLIFVFAAGAFALFFTTAVYGRIWCGWACPQTVFIDGVFRKIEQFVEGPAHLRRILAQAPFSLNKLRKKIFKYTLYILATLVLTHSFMAYFIGTKELAQMMTQSPSKNLGSFLFMFISSSIILFDFAWFREQFCTIVCPYGRFQSVLMDRNSLVVSYDLNRGEPRATPQAKALSKTHGRSLGDCINCYRCVQVCPTGIDIRRGLQMECIACTACIDVCNDVMAKLNRPADLIRYTTLSTHQLKQEKKSFNFRALVYLLICLLSIVALMVSLKNAKSLEIEVIRAKETPYQLQTLDSGVVMITNHFKLELSNQSGNPHELTFKTEADEVQIITAIQPLKIQDEKLIQSDVFIRFPKRLLLNGQKNISLIILDRNTKENEVLELKKEVVLVGPFL